MNIGPLYDRIVVKRIEEQGHADLYRYGTAAAALRRILKPGIPGLRWYEPL